jgi:signal transduction histidine kinase/CheY-like chemotaxis protein
MDSSNDSSVEFILMDFISKISRSKIDTYVCIRKLMELIIVLYHFDFASFLFIDEERLEYNLYSTLDKIGNFSGPDDEFIVEIKKNTTEPRLLDDITHNIFLKYNMIIPIREDGIFLGFVILTSHEKVVNDTNIAQSPAFILLRIFCYLIYTEQRYTTNTTSSEFFFANLSHELRTPLNGVVGYSQLLAKTKLNAVQKEYVYEMNQCSLQLIQIINDILDFTKLISKKMSVNPCYCSIQEIIEIVQDTMKSKIKEKNHSFTVTIELDVPRHIVVDKQKIVQILVNLISNAIKFTPEKGKISVNISGISASKLLIISVKDNGISIKKDDQKKLFHQFSQVHISFAGMYNQGGTGLGLLICKKLVELMGGNIAMKSSGIPGEGSTFEFQMPYELFREKQEISTLFFDKFVLIVDPNFKRRFKISDVIIQWGMKPISCVSHEEMMMYIESQKYSFSCCVYAIEQEQTPVLLSLKKISPTLPIIGISELPEEKIDCNGFIDFFLKSPVNFDELFDSLSACLRISEDKDGKLVLDQGPTKDIDVNGAILIAEDVLYNQKLMKFMLQTLGYKHLLLANNGEECIQELKKNKVSVLLLDLKMPVKTGYDVLEHMKKEKIEIPVVVITACVSQQDREKCEKYGVKDFVSKPVRLSDIKNIMSRHTQ